MRKSIWNEEALKGGFPALEEDIDCEVLVVGGGMAGVLTACLLRRRGRDVVLAEASRVGAGITEKTTAVLTAQHDARYESLIKKHGEASARAYLHANLEAVEDFRRMAADIDCDFENKPSYMYSLRQDLSGELDVLHVLGYDGARQTCETGLPFEIKQAIEFPDMAQFHPLKFINALTKELRIYEHTFVENIKGHTAFAGGHKINFRQAVVATHFPFINRHGLFFLKMFQRRSYVIALENAGDVGGTYVDVSGDGIYFRNYGNLLLVGKGDHRTGTKTEAPNELRAFASIYYPQAAIKYQWANQDCVTLDDMPYVGRYGSMEDVYVATGFNLWGMTNSMAAAKILADLLEGKENEYAFAFRPDRSILRAQLFKNLGVTLLNLVWPTVKRCPHLGCALKYNPREHSWDCQCHGSRFQSGGTLIDNPAKKDAKV